MLCVFDIAPCKISIVHIFVCLLICMTEAVAAKIARDRDWRGGEAVRKQLHLAVASNGAERRNPEKPDGFREAETGSP